MKTIGNVIWFVFGGVFIFLEYIVSSLLLMLTIIGIPFGIQTLKLAMVALWPFGKEIKTVKTQSGCLNLTMNIIWILIGGIWIFLTHIGLAILFYITIIGIPFGNQHIKLAKLALTPFGKEIIEN